MKEATVIAPAPGEIEALEKTWAESPGILGWLATVDHKAIGLRFIVTAFGFFIAAGILAAMIRLQLARPGNGLIGPDLYNQIFSMHGTTMMFLFAVPVLLGFAIYLVPLMVGARSIAFPRLNAYAYWVYLAGALMIWIAFLLNTGVDTGWFSYVPLSGPEYGPGKRVDFWAQMITFTELSALAVAVQLIATIFKLRTPGMSLNRMPLYVWAILVVSFMIVFSMPAVMLASTTLILDRLVGTHFYNYAEGGDALLWQHLFWFFGHPEVYIIFLPALGFVSAITASFCRRPVFGYTAVALAMIATGFLSFAVWAHHMFATAMPLAGKWLFTAASILIVIPTGLQFFCWIATIATGRPYLRTPFLFVLGFLITFLIGGMTGVLLASVALDTQVHDSYFVVAHLHYVLIGGAVFPLAGAVHYWFPKFTGRLMSERAGRWSFWLLLIGFNTTFFPMHELGLRGMARRVYTYPADVGLDGLNLVSSIGAVFIAASVIVIVLNILWSRRHGALAGPNPWDADTLEWAAESPPRPYNFPRPCIVGNANPLWSGAPDTAAGLSTTAREVLVTSVLKAEPIYRDTFPSPTIWPFIAAACTTVLFIGTIFTPWAAVWGSIPVAIALIAWFWPSRACVAEHRAAEQSPR